jgi:hypothetical protein
MGSMTRSSFRASGLPIGDGPLYAYDETEDFRFGVDGGRVALLTRDEARRLRDWLTAALGDDEERASR